MNMYRHFRFSLQAEFRRKIYQQIRALWADLEELKEAVDETDRVFALRQVQQRICALEQAANAVEAPSMRISKRRARRLGISRALSLGRVRGCSRD